MKNFFYTIAKTWIGSIFLHWIFAYFSFVIPGEKLVETTKLIAFYHPSPSYPLHILIVPKERYKSISDLPTFDKLFESDLVVTINDLVNRFNLEEYGYRLITNGGTSQEVDHLHFHLISDNFV